MSTKLKANKDIQKWLLDIVKKEFNKIIEEDKEYIECYGLERTIDAAISNAACEIEEYIREEMIEFEIKLKEGE